MGKNPRVVELHRQLENYGKLAVERDILERELQCVMLTSNKSDSERLLREEFDFELPKTSKRSSTSKNALWEQDPRVVELRNQLDNYGKVTVERDILQRELESFRLLGYGKPGNDELSRSGELQYSQIENYGKLAVERDLLIRELNGLKINIEIERHRLH